MTDTILYPQPMPDESAATQALEQQIFGSDAQIVRRNVTALRALSDDDCKNVVGLMIFHLVVKGEDISVERFPKLRVIVRMGVGTNDVQIDAAAARNVTVCNVPDYGTEEVAMHALTMALSLRRQLPKFQNCLFNAAPGPWAVEPSPIATRISEQTLGIVGMGRIGQKLASLAVPLGFKVIFYDPYWTAGKAQVEMERFNTLDEVLKRSNILSLHTPQTKETQGLIGARELYLLPEHAILINTARGSAVRLDPLAEVLRSRRLGGAGLDVFEGEELLTAECLASLRANTMEEDDRNHPVLRFMHDVFTEAWPKVAGIYTPHAAYYSNASLGDIHKKAAETMRDNLTGSPRNVIAPGGY